MKMNQFVVLSALALTGCGGGGKKVDSAQLQKIQKVAIVGYAAHDKMERDMNPGGMLGTLNAVKKVGEATDGNMKGRIRDQGQQVFEVVRGRIGTDTTWKVATREEVASNAAYKTLYTEMMSKGGAGMSKDWVRDADGILWDMQAVQLKPAQLDQLITDLGVDAVAIATVDFMTGKQSGVSVGGVGKRAFHPRAMLTLRLHTKGGEKPIWVARANGKATEEGMKTTLGIDDVSAETKLFLEASGTAMDKFNLVYKGE